MNSPAALPDRIHHLKLSLIAEGDRLRPVNTDRVREIAASWGIAGQLTPIEVGGPDADGIHPLITGSHRLAAARLRGEATIATIIRDAADSDVRRLREIDENLYRAELSPFDQAVFLNARQEIYERLQAATVAGNRLQPIENAKSANFAPVPKARAFAADVAEKIGLAERTVQLALTRFTRLSEASRQRLRGTRFAESGVEIDALCKRTEAQQALILDMVLPTAGEPKAETIREACAIIIGRTPTAAPSPMAIREKLERLFRQLPKGKARRDFVAWAKANTDHNPEDER